MSADAENSARWETLVWQPSISGRTRDFYVPVLISADAEAHPDQQVHKYQAMGEGQRAAHKSMSVLARHGLAGVVVDLQYDQLPPDCIERIVKEVPTFVAHELANGHAVDVQGGSVGGVPAVVAPGEAPEKYNSAGWLSPAGFLNAFLGGTAQERYGYMRNRLGWENTRKTLRRGLDWGDVEQVLGVMGVFARHKRRGQLRGSIDGALDPGLAVLAAKSTRNLVDKGVPLKLLAAEDDPFYPSHMYEQVLGAIGCSHVLEVIPGLHATVRSRAGAEQYGRLARWTKEQQEARKLSAV